MEQVIIFMPEVNKNMMGGTMRLGARATVIRDHHCSSTSPPSSASSAMTAAGAGAGAGAGSTLASVVYGTSSSTSASSTSNLVVERHRHRYEVNPALVGAIEAAGLVFSGKDETGDRMEICELPRSEHPFFFGTQFHPEFKSRPNRPSPPFFGFLAVCAGLEQSMARGGEVGHVPVL